MTMSPPSPPSRLRPRRRGNDIPRCGICAKPLRIQDIHGHDTHYGPICQECGPHLQNAIHALEIIVMRRG
jgi:ribosomal protein L34E